MFCAGHGKTPFIVKEKCRKCADCKPVANCLNRAFTCDKQESDYPFIKNDRCRSCGTCASSCPYDAVRMT